MREITTNVYKFDELSDSAKEKARDWYRRITAGDSYPLDEMVDSLKGLFEAAGIKLQDWSLGAYSRDNGVTFDMGDAGDLSGPRAMAWLENNLLAPLRVKSPRTKDQIKYKHEVGTIPSCPLTGMCYDDDFLDKLTAYVKKGETLKDSFHYLADDLMHMAEEEQEYRNEDAQVDESIEINGYEFDEDGGII